MSKPTINRSRTRNPSPRKSIHVGEGYQMFVPLTEQRDKIRAQSQIKQRNHEIHRLGGGKISLDEARRRQEAKYQSDTRKVATQTTDQ